MGLEWAPCDLDFPQSLRDMITAPVDCAIIKVHLDYTDPKDGRMVDLQLVKVNATKGPRKGSVIFNPGGPGASGVEDVVGTGPLYVELVVCGNGLLVGLLLTMATGRLVDNSMLLGSMLGKIYNTYQVSAVNNSRGTGSTMPYTCNVTAQESKVNKTTRRSMAWTLPQADVWDVLESKSWHDGGVLASACYETFKATGHLYGTAFVARDMLQIVDALDEDGKLRFWGRSYSTTLGQTFAAMFPDRVGRMFLDSVLLADD